MTAKQTTNILKKQGYASVIISFLIQILLLLYSPHPAEASPIVNSIEISGNSKISDETVLSRIESEVGSPFSKQTVRNDIKNLYGIGYFEDIRVMIEAFEGGVKLSFIFVEKPTIVKIDFQGNEEIETDVLKGETTIRPGAIANLSLIMDNVRKIKSFYQAEGYWLAYVFPIVRDISEEAVALTFRVDEGPKVKIRGVSIEGNSELPEKKIKKVMKTKKWWIFSFLTGSGTYEKEKIMSDIERIRDLYHNNGFIYVVISEPEITLSPDKKDLYIEISLSEGDRYKTGEINIKGNTVFETEELSGHVSLKPGEVFDRSALRKDIDEIVDLYMEKGYARADINPSIQVDQEEKTVNITMVITEGEVFRIGRINISGNTKTRDKVIRREVRLDERDIFNKKLIKRSYQRINNLNFFETVDLSPVPRVPEKLIDLNIDVKEKMTGMVSVGGGYSSLDKLVFMGEITQTNLFGKGLSLKLKVDLSSRRSNYRLSLTDPWFMDKPVSASISVYKEVFRYLDYDKSAQGGSIGFGKELSEYVGGKVVYNIEDVEITDISEDASDLIKEQEGRKLTSSISPSIWKDTRDNYLDPTTGARNALYLTIAGLGGDNYFVKSLADSTVYLPSFRDTVVGLRGRFGYASGFAGHKLPLYERFYVGGINTIRGLGFAEAGPRNDEGEKIGGEKELIFNAEYIVPLVKDIKLKGVLFFDYGTSFNNTLTIDDMRKTAGFGIRWLSPLGPIRLEWGFNLEPREDENNDKIEFSLGGLF